MLPTRLKLVYQGALIDRGNRLKLIALYLFVSARPVLAPLTDGATLGTLLFPTVAVSLIIRALKLPRSSVSTFFRAQGSAGGLLSHLIFDAVLRAVLGEIFLCTYRIGLLI